MVKKIAVSLVMISMVLAVSSIAADKKPAPASAKPVVTAAPVNLPSQSSAKKIALGVYAIGAPSATGAQAATIMPAISYRFTDDFVGEASINYGSAGNANGFGIMARGDYALGKGTVAPHAGGIFYFNSTSASVSNFALGACWGITANVANDFTVTADLYPITFNSNTNAGVSTTTFTLMAGALAARYWF